MTSAPSATPTSPSSHRKRPRASGRGLVSSSRSHHHPLAPSLVSLSEASTITSIPADLASSGTATEVGRPWATRARTSSGSSNERDDHDRDGGHADDEEEAEATSPRPSKRIHLDSSFANLSLEHHPVSTAGRAAVLPPDAAGLSAATPAIVPSSGAGERSWSGDVALPSSSAGSTFRVLAAPASATAIAQQPTSVPPSTFTPLSCVDPHAPFDTFSVPSPPSTSPSSSLPEVRMRKLHSYEPEKDRVVVLDLDSDSDEEAVGEEELRRQEQRRAFWEAFNVRSAEKRSGSGRRRSGGVGRPVSSEDDVRERDGFRRAVRHLGVSHSGSDLEISQRRRRRRKEGSQFDQHDPVKLRSDPDSCTDSEGESEEGLPRPPSSEYFIPPSIIDHLKRTNPVLRPAGVGHATGSRPGGGGGGEGQLVLWSPSVWSPLSRSASPDAASEASSPLPSRSASVGMVRDACTKSGSGSGVDFTSRLSITSVVGDDDRRYEDDDDVKMDSTSIGTPKWKGLGGRGETGVGMEVDEMDLS